MQYLLFAGIPTVKRQYQSYLVTTLQSVLDNITKVRPGLQYQTLRIFANCQLSLSVPAVYL